MHSKKETKESSRREFLRGAAMVGVGGLAVGVAGCTSAAAPTTAPVAAQPAATCPPLPTAVPAAAAAAIKWDRETEVLVVGYGGAGAVAAITAVEKGAKVLVIEKQAQAKHTSNTQMCLGVWVCPTTEKDAVDYMKVASRVNIDLPETQDVPDDVIQVWAKYMAENNDWMIKHGAAKDFVVFAESGRFTKLASNSAIKAYRLKLEGGGAGVGTDLFALLDKAVQANKTEILWETPATKLITNAKGEVIGVTAKSKGAEINIKAAKAVLLTTGGFEFDAAACRTYFAAAPMTFYGNPDNTGDGMRMAQALGADLWHMPVLGGGLKAKFADFPVAFSVSMAKPNYIIVNKFGKRYFSEPRIGGYAGFWNQIVYDSLADTWPRIPSYWIFDETVRTIGPLVSTVMGAAGPLKMYEWSKDNQKEIDKGWVVKANTIEELAGKLKMDPAVLKAEVEKYNAFVKAQKDTDFDRDPKVMAAIETAPFYAITAWPGMNNTFGGPRRNAKGQIVDANGKAIARLYSAGELGSVYVQYPQGGANVGECIAFGRISAENAVAEKAWG